MEPLFSPCTRLYDLVESQGRLEEFRGRYHPEHFQELNLNVSTEELVSSERAFTYADLHAMLGNEYAVAWLTPHAAVVRGGVGRVVYCWGELNGFYRLCFTADGKNIVALARSPEHLLEICNAIVRLLVVSVVHSVTIDEWTSLDRALINDPSLAYLMEQCQSLKVLTLVNLEMNENHCRVLGDYSRPGLEIVLDRCKLTSAGASALAEGLGRNKGPTKLANCKIDNFVLANGLRGNSRLKVLKLRMSGNVEVGNRADLAIASALRENKGLVELSLTRVSNEAWGAICDSLETHPTLEVLTLYSKSVPAVILSHLQALLDLVKINLSIHTIHLNYLYSEHELFRGSVVPYLKTNRFRPRLLAIQKTRPITYRAKVLGRALLSARTDANSFWMLLSGNAEVAFPSRSTAAPATNLPTLATAAAVSTTDAAAFAGPVTPAATTDLSTTAANAASSAATFCTTLGAFPFAPTVTAAATAAAANVASPSPGQKRKALPYEKRM
jgi:hypothetical protein